MTPILHVRDLTKRFGKKTVLEEITFALSTPAVTVLLGPNGAGKSTLLRLVLGLLRSDGGEIAVAGHDPRRAGRAVRELVGYVPDRPDVPQWMTPRELFRFLAPQYPRWSDALVRRASERLAFPLDTRFRALSRGEGAKAMLVAALAGAPRLLLLDEPFSGLDPLARTELLQGFLAEASPDAAVLCATHDLDLAARVAERVVVLAHGRVAAEGAVEDVLGAEGEGALPRRLYALLEGAGQPEVAVA